MAASFSDFKVVKQTTLNLVQKKTTCEELANPLPIARTTMEKLKRFKFKGKRAAEDTHTASQEHTIAFKANSENGGEHAAKKRRTDGSQALSFAGELRNSQGSSKSEAFDTTNHSNNHSADPMLLSEDEYKAGDEAESESMSQILDKDILNHDSVAHDSLPTTKPPLVATPPRHTVKPVEKPTCPAQKNRSANPIFLNEFENWNKKSSYFSEKGHSRAKDDGFSGMPTISFKEEEAGGRDGEEEEEEDYGGWDEDMASLVATESLPDGNADTEIATVLDENDDENEYGGWDDDMEEEVINNPQLAEAESEKSLTSLSFPVSKLNIADGQDNNSDEYDMDEDMDEDLMNFDIDAAGSAIHPQINPIDSRNGKPAQAQESDDYFDWMTDLFGVDDLPEQTKAPLPLRRPKIIKEVISMEDKLYSYQPVDEERPAETIVTKGWTLMPASAFETKQQKEPSSNNNQLPAQHTNNHFKSSLKRSGTITMTQNTTPPQSSPQSAQRSGRPEARRFKIPQNVKAVDLTEDKLPLSPESPALTRQSVQNWIGKSKPDLLADFPSDHDLDVEEHTDEEDEEEQEESEEEIPQQRSKKSKVSVDNYDDLADYSGDERPKWKKSNNKAAIDKNWGVGKKANDVYPNNRYTNARYIPNHIVKRYFDIISAPPADYLLQPKIVDTRPPPEKPMVPIGIKPMKFFSLEKLKEAYYNKGLNLSRAVEVYVRIIKFGLVANRTYNVQMVELYKNSVAIDGSMLCGRMNTRQLIWLDDVGKDNKGQTALVTGFVATKDENPFLDITDMCERTWPEIADDSIKAAMDT